MTSTAPVHIISERYWHQSREQGYTLGDPQDGTARILKATRRGTALVPVAVRPGPLFSLGRCMTTPAAKTAVEREVGEDQYRLVVARLLGRHVNGDYGELDAEDLAENDRSVDGGWRIMSVYLLNELTVWVITEGDRSATTVLLPADY